MAGNFTEVLAAVYLSFHSREELVNTTPPSHSRASDESEAEPFTHPFLPLYFQVTSRVISPSPLGCAYRR